MLKQYTLEGADEGRQLNNAEKCIRMTVTDMVWELSYLTNTCLILYTLIINTVAWAVQLLLSVVEQLFTVTFPTCILVN